MARGFKPSDLPEHVRKQLVCSVGGCGEPVRFVFGRSGACGEHAARVRVNVLRGNDLHFSPGASAPILPMSVAVSTRSAHAVKRDPSVMTGPERDYAAHLEAKLVAREIQGYVFKPCRWILQERSTYEPDYMVVLANGEIEFHEVKPPSGYWTEDSRCKVKAAAGRFPWFRFVGVHRDGNRKAPWKREDFQAGGPSVAL